MALALDGSVHANASSGTTLALTLTTSNADDIICVIALSNSGVITDISDDAGLTYTNRAGPVGSGAGIELWTAHSPNALTTNEITVTWDGSSFHTVDAFGVSGADTTTRFDANASLPDEVASGDVTISTDIADTFIIGGFRMTSAANPTEDTGFTKISGANFTLSEYKIVSATQSSLSYSSPDTNNGGIGDAIIIAAVGGPDLEFTGTLGMGQQLPVMMPDEVISY